MKRELALVMERRDQLIRLLGEEPDCRVEEMAKRLGVSLITVRRDLQYLEEKKLLTRFYGGARLSAKGLRELNDVAYYRDLIARYAATLIRERDSLFINTSMNALALTQYVTAQNVTVITNNGKAITQEHGSGVSILLSGGELRFPKEALVGEYAVQNLKNIFAKKAFIGCSGISARTGTTTEIVNEIRINQLMMEHAAEAVYILADHTKIGRNNGFACYPISQIKHVITDEKADPQEVEAMRAQGIEVTVVGRGMKREWETTEA
ncbi:MAG: DeoR/GlpR family DNA-binding transcription regulator [Lachnospiraceae bacterium]|nr:DeoR/GlpR family DNA-binding transcription regulator [Lachnospiraceae bacterium]MDY5742090.1 DeoR/GlpR family DNA-binding transcription regulator [Lachnospiraceae bacterium]